MKRILSVILCLCLLPGLWACSREPGEVPEASTAASTASRFAIIFDQEVRPFQIENDFGAALRYYEDKLTSQVASDQVAAATAIYLAEHRQ